MHCKDVSMRDVNVPLDEASISSIMDGWKAYVRTDDLILRNGDSYAAVRLTKEPGTGLFRKVVGFEILSLPKDTVYVEEPGLDVLNLPALANLQMRHPGKAVVVRGMFSHINYIKDVVPLKLMVVDNVPPSPAKLGVLVERALASGFVDLPVVPEVCVIDMADKVAEVRTEEVMFPCRVSHLEAPMPYSFLDDAPEEVGDVTLIGCHLSQRIFRSLYSREVPFINVCPADFTEPGVKTIVKCCKVKQGYELDGDVVRVPWGATVPEVVDAINALFSAADRPRAPFPC